MRPSAAAGNIGWPLQARSCATRFTWISTCGCPPRARICRMMPGWSLALREAARLPTSTLEVGCRRWRQH